MHGIVERQHLGPQTARDKVPRPRRQAIRGAFALFFPVHDDGVYQCAVLLEEAHKHPLHSHSPVLRIVRMLSQETVQTHSATLVQHERPNIRRDSDPTEDPDVANPSPPHSRSGDLAPEFLAALWQARLELVIFKLERRATIWDERIPARTTASPKAVPIQSLAPDLLLERPVKTCPRTPCGDNLSDRRINQYQINQKTRNTQLVAEMERYKRGGERENAFLGAAMQARRYSMDGSVLEAGERKGQRNSDVVMTMTFVQAPFTNLSVVNIPLVLVGWTPLKSESSYFGGLGSQITFERDPLTTGRGVLQQDSPRSCHLDLTKDSKPMLQVVCCRLQSLPTNYALVRTCHSTNQEYWELRREVDLEAGTRAPANNTSDVGMPVNVRTGNEINRAKLATVSSEKSSTMDKTTEVPEVTVDTSSANPDLEADEVVDRSSSKSLGVPKANETTSSMNGSGSVADPIVLEDDDVESRGRTTKGCASRILAPASRKFTSCLFTPASLNADQIQSQKALTVTDETFAQQISPTETVHQVFQKHYQCRSKGYKESITSADAQALQAPVHKWAGTALSGRSNLPTHSKWTAHKSEMSICTFIDRVKSPSLLTPLPATPTPTAAIISNRVCITRDDDKKQVWVRRRKRGIVQWAPARLNKDRHPLRELEGRILVLDAYGEPTWLLCTTLARRIRAEKRKEDEA
ncbi:hypothetical protein BU15DRAFT_59985 [Melanogaster broomeanus]|nr:hypothetical protein BU15DRAFT_59985 [Melanogaster broomeanus]